MADLLFGNDSGPRYRQLAERCRPRQWSEVVGQDKALAIIRRFIAAGGIAGRPWWITGASGTGKTTIARLLAAECADEFSTEEVDAESLSASRIAELERLSWMRTLGDKGGRAIIVNEAHGLKKPALRQLLVSLEGDRIAPHCVWIFTTTNDGQQMLIDDCEDSGPLLSRCTLLALARRDLSKPLAARIVEICQREQLGAPTVDEAVKLLQAHKNNMRAALQSCEAGAFL